MSFVVILCLFGLFFSHSGDVMVCMSLLSFVCLCGDFVSVYSSIFIFSLQENFVSFFSVHVLLYRCAHKYLINLITLNIGTETRLFYYPCLNPHESDLRLCSSVTLGSNVGVQSIGLVLTQFTTTQRTETVFVSLWIVTQFLSVSS